MRFRAFVLCTFVIDDRIQSRVPEGFDKDSQVELLGQLHQVWLGLDAGQILGVLELWSLHLNVVRDVRVIVAGVGIIVVVRLPVLIVSGEVDDSAGGECRSGQQQEES